MDYEIKPKSSSNVIVSEISLNDLNKIKEEYDSNENNYKKK